MRAHSLPAFLLLASATCIAQVSNAPDPLIGRLVTNEHNTMKLLGERRPLLESYLQLDPTGDAAVARDEYSLSRVDLGKVLNEDTYRERDKPISVINVLKTSQYVLRSMPLRFNQGALVDMLSPDAQQFDTEHYAFRFVENGFLGTRPVAIYDVKPRRGGNLSGRFLGRIWVDKHDAVLIRFSGVFNGSLHTRTPHYIHFDSWRSEVVSGLWMPAATYLEDDLQRSSLHGQLRLWGYDLARTSAPGSASEASIQVLGAVDDVRDVSPLESLRAWREQAEQNIIDELGIAGLLAPEGDFEKRLDQIVINLAVPNKIDLSHPIHCRVLLTTPLETASLGNTILISKGLIDTVPSVDALASFLAWQLAHMQLEHNVDTRYAFSDRLMFRGEDAYLNLHFAHTAQQNRAAAKYAADILNKSMYADKTPAMSVYYSVLDARAAGMKNLTTGRLGDPMLSESGQSWIGPFLPHTTYAAAMTDFADVPKPLGSSLVLDPWTDTVRWLEAQQYELTAADLYPFAVLPYYAEPAKMAADDASVNVLRDQSPRATQ